MGIVHAWIGAVIVGLLLGIFLFGLGLRITGRAEAPTMFWGVQHWTENILLAQVAIGVILLVIGRRVVGDPLVWLHYLYGSLFPVIALVGGRIAGLRRDTREYVGVTWGAFFAFGLTMRALMTGCGDLTQLGVCLGLS